MTTEDNPEITAETEDPSEPTMLDHLRFERRVSEPAPSSDWRSAVPAELLQRIKSRSASSEPGVVSPTASAPLSAANSAVEAGEARLPSSYRAPFLPEDPAEPHEVELDFAKDGAIPVTTPFQGLDANWESDDYRVLVSVRPVRDAALADRVAGLLTQAPGMSDVHSLGAAGDIVAFDAAYRGEAPRMEAVSLALESIGASLVSTGDREFYLAIQGQTV